MAYSCYAAAIYDAGITCFSQKLHHNVRQDAQQWPYNNVHVVSMDQMAEAINISPF